jgi:hypothetical protein
LNPEQWGSPLVQGGYQGEKTCDIIIIIIVLIIIIIINIHFLPYREQSVSSVDVHSRCLSHYHRNTVQPATALCEQKVTFVFIAKAGGAVTYLCDLRASLPVGLVAVRRCKVLLSNQSRRFFASCHHVRLQTL